MITKEKKFVEPKLSRNFLCFEVMNCVRASKINKVTCVILNTDFQYDIQIECGLLENK
jgi:hypothetical protein